MLPFFYRWTAAQMSRRVRGRTIRRKWQHEALEPRTMLTATVMTDFLDYPPGATANIYASGYQSGEAVQFQVLHNDGTPNTGNGHEPWVVVDGSANDLDGLVDGNVHTTWYVDPDDSLNSSFTLTADGLDSGLTASTDFTDSRAINSVTLNGGTSVNVAPGATISAAVSVTTTASPPGGDNWQSTGWRIATTAPGSVTNENHGNHDTAGTNTETFNITAPNVPGVYNAYFISNEGNSAGMNASATYVMLNAVTVSTTVSITANDSTAGETSGTGQYTVSLADGVAPTGGIVVNYTALGTATGGADYAVLSGSVTIAAGQSSATINVSGIVNDQTVEGTETVLVSLTSTNHAQVSVGASNAATVNISDNDTASVSISSGTTNVTEGGAAQPVTATLSLSFNGSGTQQLAAPIQVKLVGNADYTSTTATFPTNSVNNATQTINVSAVDDLLSEPFPESFSGQALTVVSGPASVSGSRTIVITDNDQVQNPELAQACGVDMVLVLDVSGSISSTEYNSMVTAFTAFINAFDPLEDTQFALVAFDSGGMVVHGFTDDGAEIIDAMSPRPNPAGDSGTNWDVGLYLARNLFPAQNAIGNRSNYGDLIVFSSDGNPNARGGHTAVLGHTAAIQSTSETDAMEWAIEEADEAKGDGIRIVTVGIGDDLNVDNLKAVSGTNQGPPVNADTDVIVTSNFVQLEADLQALADALCPVTISGHKWHDLDSDSLWDSGEPGVANWTIYLDNDNNLGNGFITSTTTDANGKYTFDNGGNGHPHGEYYVSEQSVSGWNPTYGSGGYFVDATDGHHFDGDFGQTESLNFGNKQEATPTITIVKTVDADENSTFNDSESVSEGGVGDQKVDYKFVITNTSSATDPVTISSLLDNRTGSLLATFMAANGGSATLAPGASVTFFANDHTVTVGDVDDTYVNTVSASGTDNEGTSTNTATDTATVTYANSVPAISIVKTVDANEDGTFNDGESVQEGGVGDQKVDYKFVITNTSSSTDPVTISSLLDNKVGSLLAAFTAANGGSAVLAPGASVTFNLNDHVVAVGDVGDSYVNTVTASGTDDEATSTNSATDTATVTYTDVTPSITIVKTVDANEDGTFNDTESVDEGGVGDQKVDYKFVITNTSSSTDPVTITSLLDDKVGSLLAAFTAANGGSAVLAPGASVTFFLNDHTVAVGDTSDSYVNTVTANGRDDEAVATNVATDTATVRYEDVRPSITVVKTVDADEDGTFNDTESVSEGGVGDQKVDYKFVVTNTSSSTDPLTITSILDDRVGNLLAALMAANGGSATLTPGASVTFYLNDHTVAVGDVGGSYVNTVTIHGVDDNGTGAVSPSDTATVTYTGEAPSITIVKTVDADEDGNFGDSESVSESGVGDQKVDYKFVITNTSSSTDPVTIASLLDNKVGSLFAAFTSANGGSAVLAPGASVTFFLNDHTVAAGDVGDSYVNTVSASGTDDEGTATNSATDTATVTYTDVAPSITIVKTVDADEDGTFGDSESVSEGGVGDQNVDYQFVVTNTSSSTDPVTISTLLDDKVGSLLAAFTAANGGSATLAPGASVTFFFNDHTVAIGDVGDNYINTVSASGTDDEGTATNSATDTATVTYTSVGPSITIVKTVDADEDGTFNDSESVQEGGVGDQKVDYKFVITNTSSGSTDPVTISSLLDDKVGSLLAAFTAANGGSATLAPGASVTFFFNDHTVAVVDVGDSYVNTVTASGSDDEGTATNSATDTATVSYTDVGPSITIVKTVDADEDGTFNDSESVSEGGVGDQKVDYKFVITNTSSSTDPVTITSLLDDRVGSLLAAFTAANGGSATLAPGASVTFYFNDHTVAAGDVGDSYVNTVTAGGSDDEATATNSATDTATVTYTGVGPSITIVKTVDADEDGIFNGSESVSEGGVGDQKVDYKFVITNTSTNTDPVTISSLLDDRVGSLLAAFTAANGGSATLAPGASVTFFFNDHTVAVGDVGDSYVNTVTADGSDDEGAATNNATDTASVTYTGISPSISIVKTVDADEDGTFNDSESVQEGGVGDQKVDYKFVITNTSSSTDPVTISSLLDDKVGSLLAAFTAANGGSATLTPGASVTFFLNDHTVAVGDVGDTYVNTVSASGADDEATTTNTATDTATVTYTGISPSISIVKTVDADEDGTFNDSESVQEGGVGDQKVDYKFVITNTSTGTDPVTISSLLDDKVGSLLAAFLAASGGSATLAPGASVTFFFNDHTVAAGDVGDTYVNTVTASGADDETTATNTATDTATVTYTGVGPSITIVKTVDADEDGTFNDSESVSEGGVGDQKVDYKFVITNTSSNTDPVTISSLLDDKVGSLLAAFTAANGGSATLAPGASVTFFFDDHTVAVGDVGDTYVNTVSAGGADDEGTTTNSATDTATVTYTGVGPSITIVKTVDANEDGTFNDSESVSEGGVGDQKVDYKFVITNTSVGTDPVTISSLPDDKVGSLLAAFTAANGGSATLTPGASVTFFFNDHTVAAGDVGDSYVNTVTASGADDEGTTTNSATDTATVTYTGVGPSISIVKTVDANEDGTYNDSESVSEGGVGDQQVDYKFVITNTSSSTDPVTVSSLLDDKVGSVLAAFMTANGGSAVLAPGASVTFFLNDHTVAAGDVGASYVNTITAGGADDEGTSTNTATDSATVTYSDVAPSITIVKSVDADEDGTFADSESVSEGGFGDQKVDYMFVVTNTSSSTDPVTISSLLDDKVGSLLAAFTAANGGSAVLAPNASVTFYLNDHTAAVGDVGGSYVNTVTASGADVEGTVTNTATDSATVNYTGVAPTITIVKTVDADEDGNSADSESVSEGGVGDQKVDYKFVITNTSSSTDPVTISSLLDDKVGSLLAAFTAANGGSAVLAPGASVTFFLNDHTVAVGDVGNSYVNTVSASGADDEGTPTNSATDSATVTYTNVGPSITVAKTVDANEDGTFNDSESVDEGGVGDQKVDYKFVITNTSSSTDPVTIASLLDDKVGSLLAAFTAANGGSAVLAPGASVTFYLNDHTVAIGDAGGSYVNTVTASGSDDEGTATNSATDTATVTYSGVAPSITIVKTVDANEDGTFNDTESVSEGGVGDQKVDYKFVITNTSSSTDPVTISSLLDDKVGSLLAALTAANGGSAVLAPGASVTFYLNDHTVAVGDVGGSYVNTITANGTDDEGAATNSATDAATVTYTGVAPSITIVKTVDADENGSFAESESVSEGGVGDQKVDYKFVITNTSSSTDPVTISSLLDDKVGSLLAAYTAANGGSAVLAPGASVTFHLNNHTVTVGDVGASYINTVTASGSDDDGAASNLATDTATVTYSGVTPAISVVKTVDANEDGIFNGSEPVVEGGVGDQKVDYRFVITNSSSGTDPVTISSLADDNVGNLLAGFIAANGGSATLVPGASVTFFVNDFVVPVGDVGDSHVNTISASGVDDELTATNTATDTATVTYSGVAPSITVVKSVDADEDGTFGDSESVSEGGIGDQKVDYKFTVTNNSPASTDPVAISSLLDDRLGSLLPALIAANGGSATLAAGASVTFYFHDHIVLPGAVGSTYVNTLTASGADDDGMVTNVATDTATVTYTRRPIVVIAPDKSNTSTSLVKVVDHVTGQVLSQFYAYETNFMGGVRVATADMDGDGLLEIITAPGPGRAPEIRVFKQITPTTWTELTSFRTMAYASTFKGGVDVAVGDVNGDGRNDIVTAPLSGRTEVRVFYNNAPNADPIPNTPSKQFYVFDKKFLGGADVAVADMVPGGKQEIIVGSGPGMRATAQVFTETGALLDTVLPFANTFKGGITVDAVPVKINSPLHNDNIPDLVIGSGNGGGSKVEVWSGVTNDATDVRLAAFTAFGNVSSLNAPVHAVGLDTDNDGLADRIVAVQGTDGTSNQIRSFTTTGSPTGSHSGFPAPWNIAALRTPPVVAPVQPLALKVATSLTATTSSSSQTTTQQSSAVDSVFAAIGAQTTTTAKKKRK